MRHKVFWNELSLSPLHNGREMWRTTIDMFHWTNPKKTHAAHKGARIEIASFSEWLANSKRCAKRKASE